MTVWPSGLRRWLQAPVRKGVGSNPTAVINAIYSLRAFGCTGRIDDNDAIYRWAMGFVSLRLELRKKPRYLKRRRLLQKAMQLSKHSTSYKAMAQQPAWLTR